MDRLLLHAPFGNGASEAPAPEPELLAAGIYWKSGLTKASPYDDQGWNSGLPGLSDTGEIVMLRVLGSPITLGNMGITLTYDGSVVSESMGYWDGSAAQVISPDLPTPWSEHLSYTQDSNSHIFLTGPTSAYFYWAGGASIGGVVQGDAFTATV